MQPHAIASAQRAALSRLLAQHASETTVDRYLRARPELLAACLNFTSFGHHGAWVIPQASIRPPQKPDLHGLKPDYIVGGKGSGGFLWLVVELKAVSEHVFAGQGSSLRLSSAANKGLVQLLRYVDYCCSAQAYLRDSLHLTGFREPAGVLIIGSEAELSASPERQTAREALNRAMAGRIQIRSHGALLRSHP